MHCNECTLRSGWCIITGLEVDIVKRGVTRRASYEIELTRRSGDYGITLQTPIGSSCGGVEG